MIIGELNTQNRVLIVAEIGNNHEGSFDTALQLIDRAHEAGVDAVKFQTFRTEFYVSQRDAQRFDRLKGFELSYAEFEKLAAYAKAKGLLFLSTPFDLESADFLSKIVDGFKIASGDNNFFPLIERVIQKGLPTVVSSGASDEDHVMKIANFVCHTAPDLIADHKFALLHCVSSYPVEPENADLKAIQLLAEQLPGITVGYSDHTEGLEAAVLSVALGARIIEKHFTLDKNFSDFRDHQLSADPEGMKSLIRQVRLAETLLGRKQKIVQPVEQNISVAIRRSIVASADLPKGHQITPDDLTWIRPGGGIDPGNEQQLIGRVLIRDLAFGDPIKSEDIL